MKLENKTVLIINLFLALLLLIALFIAAFNISSVRSIQSEARGRTKGTLTITPNPVPVGTTITISGAGLRANTTHLVGVLGYVPWNRVTTDSGGYFALSYTRTSDPTVFPAGTYYVEAQQETSRGFTTVSSTTFTVQ